MDALIDLAYVFVLGVVRVYRILNSWLMKLTSKRVKFYLTQKLTRIGVNVVNSSSSCDKPSGNGVNKKGQNNDDVKMVIHDQRFFARFASHRSMGLGESYMEGWWDCDNLDELFTKIFSRNLFNFARHKIEAFAHYIEFDLFNLQTIKRATDVTREHYDLGNQLFESFLDRSMTYTCAYWKNANNLEEAQHHKLELIAQKLKLKPGMTVLELGCGWGALAYHLAKNHGVSVVACNIAKEGARMTEEKCRGLPVKVHCGDYREMSGKYDRVVAVGLHEHVGPKNYRGFYELAHRCLDDGGIFVCHTIGIDDDRIMRTDPWLCTYIFPNGSLPRADDVTKSLSSLFIMEDWQNLGADYDTTLMAWHENFVQNWHTIEHLFKNPTKFYRMWKYYLLMCAAAFRSRRFQLWQIVLTKNTRHGYRGRYDAPREISKCKRAPVSSFQG